MSLRLLSYVLAFPYFELFTSVSRKIKKKYCKSSFNNNNDNKNVIRRINTIKIFIQHVLHFARYPLDLSLNYLLSCTSVFSRGLSISKQTDRGILVRQKRREKELSFLLRRGYDGAGIYIYIYIYSWLVDRGRGKGRHYPCQDRIVLAVIQIRFKLARKLFLERVISLESKGIDLFSARSLDEERFRRFKRAVRRTTRNGDRSFLSGKLLPE